MLSNREKKEKTDNKPIKKPISLSYIISLIGRFYKFESKVPLSARLANAESFLMRKWLILPLTLETKRTDPAFQSKPDCQGLKKVLSLPYITI